MQVQRLWVPGCVPSLNELFAARGQIRRVAGKTTRVDGYNELKRMWEQRVVLCARTQRLQPIGSAFFTYLFREPDERRDPSNFMASGIKIVEDGLRKSKLLTNDGWKHVLGIAPYWVTDRRMPGVTVLFSQYPVRDKMHAVQLDTEQNEAHGQNTRQTTV